MIKSELVRILAEKNNIPKTHAMAAVTFMIDAMSEALAKGERVEIRGFGSFHVKDYDGYFGRNPKTGETVEVKPKRAPFFRVGKELKEKLNE